MKKLKLRWHIRAPVSRLKASVRSLLTSSASTRHATATPPPVTETVISPENGENLPSRPDHSSDTPSTQTLAAYQEYESFKRRVEIHFRDEENLPWPSHYTHAVALFDTGSTHNYVTRQFLEENRVEWQPSTSATSIVQLSDEKIEVLGEVQGRWYPLKHDKDYTFRPRYEICTFKVVDSKNCELIIGSITISELRLFKPNPTFFANFRARPKPVERMFCPFAIAAQLLTCM